MPTLPAGVGYGTVRWTAAAAVMDTLADVDIAPDLVAVLGTVTFTPSVSVFRVPYATPPMTLFAAPVTATLYSDGTLRDAHGNVGITLMATDSPGLDVAPDTWSWFVSFQLNSGRNRTGFSFMLDTGQTIDLTTIAPVGTGTGGVQIQQGRGVTSVAINGSGNLIVTFSDGSTVDAGPSRGEAYGGGFLVNPVGSSGALDLDIYSRWGIDDAGQPYYNSLGAPADEAALVVPDLYSGGFLLFRPGDPTPVPTDAEGVRDVVASALVAGSNVSIVPNDVANTITIGLTGLAAVATSGAKADVGLGNVDNTSDANKPVSTAQTTALNLKQNSFVVTAAVPSGGSDTSALQALIDAVSTAGGGVVQLQRGDYSMTAALSLKDKVILRGLGRKASRLVWSTDLGAATYAVTQPGGAGTQVDAPSLENLSLVGPGGAISPGVTVANMDGWKAGRNVHGTDLYIGGFRSGIVIIGDHNTFIRVKSSNNYYNVLYASAYTTKGNQCYIACELDGAAFACVAVEGANVVDSSQFIGGHLGFAPYGFYKFDGGSASTIGLLSNCVLDGISFESIGNGAILDESTGTGGGSDTLYGTTIVAPGMSWSGTYKIAARNKDYAVVARNITSTEVIGGSIPFVAGDIATFYYGGGATSVGLRLQQDTLPSIAGNAPAATLVSASGQAARAQFKTFGTGIPLNTTPQTVAVPTKVGDLLIAIGTVATNATTLSTPTGGTSLTWTLQQSITTANYSPVYVWTAIATTQETATISFARATGTGYYTATVLRTSAHAGVGASATATNTSPSAPTISLTTTRAGSTIVTVFTDWNGVDGAARVWRSTAGQPTESLYSLSAAVTTYVGYNSDVGATGSKTVGLTNPATEKAALVALEVFPY